MKAVQRWILFSLLIFAQASLQAAQLNPPETIYLSKNHYQLQYPNEKLPVIMVENSYELGKLSALSFIDWVANNPSGVIALPTGKTPEYFIKFLDYYQSNWDNQAVQQELQDHGIKLSAFPDTSQLKFVQLDEFYGLAPEHKRSFTHYVKEYYLKPLQIKEENALLITLNETGILKENGYSKLFPSGKVDLSLLNRKPINSLEHLQKQALIEAQRYCQAYEQQIRDWGGIGFFIGGIGVDGHVAFNLPGVDLDSPTHLAHLNYQTSAQSAVDLGGIENARDRVVMTIGLGTLQINPDAKVIILASGELKAPAIKAAIEGPIQSDTPASKLQAFNNPIMYLTKGASMQLSARVAQDIETELVDMQLKHKVIIQTALDSNKKIADLTKSDLNQSAEGRALLETTADLETLLNEVIFSLHSKIESGLNQIAQKTTLHTAPHHDDVMLSYYPLVGKMLGKGNHHFAYLTSGFNSVTDQYILDAIEQGKKFSLSSIQRNVFKKPYTQLLSEFREAVLSGDETTVDTLEPLFVYHKIKESYGSKDAEALLVTTQKIKKALMQKEPGNTDTKDIQQLKGEVRETEADRLWAINQVPYQDVHHMRSKFYTGAIFDPLPNLEDDAKPLMGLIDQIQPELVTVALDPEGTGPDTHYKVLQVVAQSLSHSPTNPIVWGYRNVWHRFDFSDANLFFPVQYKELNDQHQAFMHAFATQKSAAFPSFEHDGPFSELSMTIQKRQLAELKRLLGNEYFDNHPSPLVRNASGFVLIKQMPKHDFLVYAEDLKRKTQLLTSVG